MIKRMLQVAVVAGIVFVSSSSLLAFGIGVYGNGGGGYGYWADVGTGHYYGGGGIILDTNLAYNRVFNYRLEFGASYINIGATGESVMIHMNHYFGLGVVRTKLVRFWIGPMISLSGLVSNIYGSVCGTGLALGLNFNFGEVFTLSITGTGRFIGGIADGSWGYGGDGMCTIAFLFRVNQDVYSRGRY